MKAVPFNEVRAELARCLDQSQVDRVLITRHGRPVAVLIGVEDLALEDLLGADEREVWELLQGRPHKPRSGATRSGASRRTKAKGTSK